jgi:hypothetical protein
MTLSLLLFFGPVKAGWNWTVGAEVKPSWCTSHQRAHERGECGYLLVDSLSIREIELREEMLIPLHLGLPFPAPRDLVKGRVEFAIIPIINSAHRLS